MENFKLNYSVSKEFINAYPTVVIHKDESIVGFYGLLIKDREISLEYFFIEPKYLGNGYGKLLWNYLVEHCKNLGIKKLRIITSPQAKEFYTKMGAEYCEDVESILKKGRIIPLLTYKIQKQ